MALHGLPKFCANWLAGQVSMRRVQPRHASGFGDVVAQHTPGRRDNAVPGAGSVFVLTPIYRSFFNPFSQIEPHEQQPHCS